METQEVRLQQAEVDMSYRTAACGEAGAGDDRFGFSQQPARNRGRPDRATQTHPPMLISRVVSEPLACLCTRHRGSRTSVSAARSSLRPADVLQVALFHPRYRGHSPAGTYDAYAAEPSYSLREFSSYGGQE